MPTSKTPAIILARKNPRVNALYERIKNEGLTIRPKQVRGDSWGTEIVAGVAHLQYCGCTYPSAALAHELLHLDTQLKGYKRIRIGFSEFDTTPTFRTFMEALDNELQHHKFFAEFLDMGFTPSQFYCDSDREMEGHLRRVARRNDVRLNELLPDFFSLIAPGGSMSESTKQELLKAFYNVNGGRHACALLEIKRIIEAWGQNGSYDSVPVITEIMLTLKPRPNKTWFGFEKSQRPPNQGFFVDERFTVVE